MIKSLEDLKKEKEMLELNKENRLKIFKDRIERQKLKREIRELKYPATYSAIKTISKTGKIGLTRIGVSTRDALKRQYEAGRLEREKLIKKNISSKPRKRKMMSKPRKRRNK